MSRLRGYGKSLIKQLLRLVRSCSLSKRIVIAVPHAWQKITPIPVLVGCTESIFLFLSDSDVLLGTDECRSSLQTLPLSRFIGSSAGADSEGGPTGPGAPHRRSLFPSAYRRVRRLQCTIEHGLAMMQKRSDVVKLMSTTSD